jgi:cytochrome c peroxidase
MILALSFLVACEPVGDAPDTGLHIEEDAKVFSNDEIRQLRQHWPLPDVPLDSTNRYGDDPYAEHLGQYLFYDSRFSGNGEVSCSTCHNPEFGWSDGLRISETIAPVNRHAPTLWNAGYMRWAFWDGRCDSLWCQALQPFESEAEMGGNRMAIAHAVLDDGPLRAAYVDVFGEAPDFGDGTRFPSNARPDADPEHPFAIAWAAMRPDDQEAVNRMYSNLGKAIAAFERRIVSREAPFDQFAKALLTDSSSEGLDAISDAAARGIKLFLGQGKCHFCHEGPNFTNQEFGNVGVGLRDWLDAGDQGRLAGVIAVRDNPFNGNGSFSDDVEAGALKLHFLNIGYEQEGQFKVPTLRNVSTHPPYFHGGQAEDLLAVVRHYGEPDLDTPEFGHREDLLRDVVLDENQVSDLVAFLQSLTSGPMVEAFNAQPESPLVEN